MTLVSCCRENLRLTCFSISIFAIRFITLTTKNFSRWLCALDLVRVANSPYARDFKIYFFNGETERCVVLHVMRLAGSNCPHAKIRTLVTTGPSFKTNVLTHFRSLQYGRKRQFKCGRQIRVACQRFGDDHDLRESDQPGFCHTWFAAEDSSVKPTKRGFPYSSVRMLCKHGGTYRGHRKDEEPSERLITATSKMECPFF